MDKEPKAPPKPGAITAIEPQQRDDARMNIHINGAFAFGLHADIVLEHSLRVGSALSEAIINSLLQADEVKKATMAALNLIAFRPRASGELQRKLREKGYSPDAAEKAVARMLELGYLNDAAFAERWVENRQEHRPRSARMLQRELREKGVDADTVAEVLEGVNIDEVADALTLAQKKAATMSALDLATRHRRISGFLGRRGYGYDVIRRVLESIE